jgi:hypothetical protein
VFLAVMVALATLSAVAAEKPAEAAKGPRISVEPADFDFGKVVQQKTLQKEFSIRNYGTEDLVIESVSTTCGCTAALMDSKIIKPGGTTPLRVSLETRNYSGRVERKVLVRSNDTTKNMLEIKVGAEVQPAAAAK